MSYFSSKFIYTDQQQDETEITDATEVRINIGNNLKNNSLNIDIKNNPINVFSDGTIRHRWVDKNGEVIFKAIKVTSGEIIDEEVVDVYANWTDLNPTIDVESDDYLLMSGIINEGEAKQTESGNIIELKCVDRNYVILNKLTIPQAFSISSAVNAAEIIQKLVQNSCENQNYNTYGFNSAGNLVQGTGFLIDAGLFSDRIKKSGTTTSATTNHLIDSGANFLSSGINKEDWVRNTTTNDYAYVRAVTATNLTLSKDIMTSGIGYQISNGLIQDRRVDGTVFPDITFSYMNKPLSETFSTLSQVDMTNSPTEYNPSTGTLVIKRSMIFFIDKKHRFHWYVPSDTAEYIMQVGQTAAVSPDEVNHKIVNVSLNRSTIGNVNFIIYKAGEDMNNSQIKSFEYAPFTGTPNAKECLRQWNEIADGMKVDEARVSNIVQVGGTQYNYPVSYNPLPNGDTYPIWDTTQAVIPTNATTYNAAFKTEALKRAKAKAKAEFVKMANPRWNGKIIIRGEFINVGDLINFTSLKHGIKNVKMRVEQVTHTINANEGWMTTLQMLEDEREWKIG